MTSIILNKILNKIDVRLKGLQVRQCKENLQKAGYDKLFANAENDAFPPEYFDLWTLVEEINRTKPKHVLEYGSGCSTYVIAETLNRIGGDWKITSVELDQDWKKVKNVTTSTKHTACVFLHFIYLIYNENKICRRHQKKN